MVPMISRSSEYAIRAMTYMAKEGENKLYLNREISATLGIPRPFLTKILRALTEANLLTSQRGRGGGFQLARPAAEISLLDMTSPFESIDSGICLLGQDVCSEEHSCPVHDTWKQIRARLNRLFSETSLSAIATAARPDLFPISQLGLQKLREDALRRDP